jgi:predicted dehydrogenase
MPAPSRPTRRDFLKTAATISAGGLALPTIIPSSALGLGGAVAPSERIVMGCIGVGGKGTNNMGRFLSFPDVQVVAVCDADEKHRTDAQRRVNEKYGNADCQSYGSYLDLVGRGDLDAVSVATPDHWHALATIAAVNAGADVYCEKPLSNSVNEGRAMVRAAEKNNRIIQCGSHERSTSSIRLACEQVRNGKIGKVHTVEIHLPTTDGHHVKVMQQTTAAPVMPVPDSFDYDAWLGYTPWRPFRPFMPDAPEQGCHFWWRFNMLYGGGEMTDRGAHVIDLAQLGLGTDDTGPVEFEAQGDRATGGVFDAFFNFSFTNTYASGVNLVGSTAEPRGLKFIGDDGWIFIHVHGGKLEASDPKLTTEEDAAGNRIKLGRSPGHHRNFVDCIKSREQPFAAGEIGHRTASLCHINNIAMKLQRKVKWDPAKEQFIGDDEANRLLAPPMRSWLKPEDVAEFS